MLAALTPPAETTARASPAGASGLLLHRPRPGRRPIWSALGGPSAMATLFELSIDENNQFTWKAVPKVKPPSP